jgi:tetratricopeptide (TPR) repeat protein
MLRADRWTWLRLACAGAYLILARPGSPAAHPGVHEQEQAVADELALRPGDPEMHLRQGRLLAERGEWDAALEAYERARSFGADSDRVDVVAGAALLDAGWPRMAKRRFDTVLERNPGRDDARLGRARAWVKLDHPEAAAVDFAAALERMADPRPAYALEQRDVLLAIGRREEALTALDRAISRIGVVPTLLLAAIDVALDLERYDDALLRIDGLLKTSPGHPLWIARRAAILDRAGRRDEARAAYADALERVRSRSARAHSRRLDALEGELREALAQTPDTLEGKP